jgi:alpha-L-rhamnosidase
MGLLSPDDWKAKWISAQNPLNHVVNGDTLPPSPYLRRTFSLSGKVKSATVFVTARGVYELHLNGEKIGHAVLAPGWTDYPKHIDYQAYDVTSSLHDGENTVGAILGDGWYAGYYGFGRQRNLYGDRPHLLLQMQIQLEDGKTELITSDGQWTASTGPILSSDLLQGESYDARKELTGWDTTSYKASDWLPVTTSEGNINSGQADVTGQLKAMVSQNKLTVAASNDLFGDPAYNTVKVLHVVYTIDGAEHSQTVAEHETLNIPGPNDPAGTLVIRHAVYGAADQPATNPVLAGAQGPPVIVTEYMPVKAITTPAPNTYIYDIGQNMVGWARLKAQEPAGTTITMRFAEVLNPDGTIYTTNLRSARATDSYTFKGTGVETWEPHFTFHGFRYVEITGLNAKPPMDLITGCVVGSDIPVTGTFTCSSPLVNQIQKNVVWGQRGNFLSIPTDCPQRDERLGWMGDAQIFARTATYNRYVASFYEKWITDVEDAQSSQGAYSDVSPRKVDDGDGAPAWGDAGVIVPWTVWQAYGDTSLVAKHWASMEAWMNYITSVNPNGLWLNRRNNDFGDWLSINADTPKEVLATAYYAHDAQLMAQMAAAIGHTEDAEKYNALLNKIKAAFDTAYVQSDGTVHGDTQTSYLVALHWNLLPDNLKPLAAQHLADAIHRNNDHLSTGFVGVGYLCPTLTDNGLNDIAYKLLLTDTFPSWGFSVRQGATTIWERWDGWTPDKGFQDPGMNSFNHYSLGSVSEWLYRYVAGIDGDTSHPGFEHILLHPHPGPGLTSVDSSFNSIRGLIVSQWKEDNGSFDWNFTIPANTTATVTVPSDGTSEVTQNGKSVTTLPGIQVLTPVAGSNVYELGSGTYHFVSHP